MTDEDGIPGDPQDSRPARTSNEEGPSPAIPPPPTASEAAIQGRILLHLLRHHGELIRFEASQSTTESGIVQGLPGAEPVDVRRALRSLEQSRRLFRRSQYVVGTSDMKIVYVLTSSGHRMALELLREPSDGPEAAPGPK